MISKIYTKTGDSGETSLLGGSRVRKSDIRVEAYGTIDELNSTVGAALPHVTDSDLREALIFLMHKLMCCASNTAAPPEAADKRPVIKEADTLFLEQSIDWMQAAAGPITGFVLPTGTPAAGLLHTARTVCRRAERRLTTLAEKSPIDPMTAAFINRASDFLFAAARLAASQGDTPPPRWDRDIEPPKIPSRK